MRNSSPASLSFAAAYQALSTMIPASMCLFALAPHLELQDKREFSLGLCQQLTKLCPSAWILSRFGVDSQERGAPSPQDVLWCEVTAGLCL